MRKILHMNLRMSWEFYIDESKSYQIHIAMGVYKIEDITIPVSVMCDRANMALRTIKDNFMEKVAYYDEYMRENVLKEQILAGEIPRAIENGEIKIYLQGICDAKGDVLGAEALVRWEHPSKGILPAEDGTWLHFDLVPEEYEVRTGAADYTGRICVIGTNLDRDKIQELFGI